jgi:hypothetical protein
LVDQNSEKNWQIFGTILVGHLGFGKGIFQRIFPTIGSFWLRHSSLRSLRFLAGFKEFLPPLAILVGMAENEQSTKKVGIDIL